MTNSDASNSSTTAAQRDDAGRFRVQRVVFIRHSVAKHNVADPATGERPDHQDPAYFDSPLIPDGKAQALRCGSKLRQWWHTHRPNEPIELVMVSPLTRCLQTAALIFLPGDSYEHSPRKPRFKCCEYIREAFGKHYSDRRRQKSLLMEHWPDVEFEAAMTQDDTWWHPSQRETIPAIKERIQTFLSVLCRCQERGIVVVTHGVWIEVCFHFFAPEVLDHGRRRVYNCNMFAADCLSDPDTGEFRRFRNAHQIG